MSADHISRQRPSLLQLLTLLCFLSVISPSKSDDLPALLRLKSALEKSNTRVFDTWTPENSICNFTGVVCETNQVVKEINLSQQHLSGTLPFDSICALQALEKISFGSNFLYGSINTEDLTNCTSLQYLDLGQNSFTGTVPDLSSLSQLKFLSLNQSGFSGPFPWKSMENLTSLTFLSLGDNPFDRSSFPLEIAKLDKLYWLYLSNCSLGGKIPEGIGNLTLLENLELSDNHLFGEIPEGITKLTRLRQLELYNNQLTGKLPVGFGNLTSLVNFDASTNSLEGDLSELKSLTQLASLQLFENQFSGVIPEEFGDFKYLEEFSLYTNKLTGSLPQKIGSLANFIYIDVVGNLLTGPIPPDMCKNGKMDRLLLLENKFTGGIPATYANCSSLVRLRVNNNSLSGKVPPGIWSLPKLIIIDLALNQFEGSVTTDIGDAESLAQLCLANNRFSGELPATISEASSLVAIDLSSNQFSGEIPSTIGELKKLSSLHFEDNQFSGVIPNSLGSCVSLSEINLAGNSLSGNIPATLGSIPTLNSLNLSINKLSGEIPASLSSLRLSLLDLSNNRLIGRIPESLSVEIYNGSFAGNSGLCSQTIRNFRPCSSDSGMSSQVGTVTYCIIAGGTVLIVSLACFIIYVKLRQKDQDRLMERADSWDMKQFHVLSFTEEEIVNSIKQENLIGKGGSGNVYKVILGSGKHLAVKHVWKSDSGERKYCRSSTAMLAKGKSRSPEYDAEVATLSSVRHVNVVKLYCSITSEDWNLLVYEYLPNGSLWDRLHMCRKMDMDWTVRYEIAMGSAKGLEYLHHGCDRPVIHRDVKSSNILLDEQMKPRIADFGLAKTIQANGAKEFTQIVAGTHGYIAPGRKKNLVLRAQSIGYKSEQQLSESMDLRKEFPDLNRNLYPEIEPYSSGFLKVSDLHTIYWEQSGNPNGHPVVFLHGGPGGGTSPSNRRFFDPDFYRIILFDQRGAGKSTPHACLVENTTWDLVEDIERLREHLDIPEWQVFGGSWGSTLALAYSQSHPDKVTGIVLRGIFLLRKKEIDWFYEGGAAAIYPDAWEPFRDLIPENERGCFIDAYSKRLNSDDMETQYAAARAWTKWEMMTAHLLPNEENIKRGDDDGFSLAFARIENHYFVNRGFFSSDSFLLDNVDKIRHINTTIVQGRYDVCCPMMSAWDLHKAWPEAEFKVVADAGHSANEPGIAAELVAANEKLKNLTKNNGSSND